jgi:hypothetical protein
MAWKIDPFLSVIAQARNAVRRHRAGQPDYDSHDVIRELSDHHNQDFRQIVALYRGPDPVRTATQQIGKALEKIGEVQIGKRISDRKLILPGVPMGRRNGRCQVTVWRI